MFVQGTQKILRSKNCPKTCVERRKEEGSFDQLQGKYIGKYMLVIQNSETKLYDHGRWFR